ncbi:MAG: hypothetical protein ACLTZY_06810 [Alistipes indistinctus]
MLLDLKHTLKWPWRVGEYPARERFDARRFRKSSTSWGPERHVYFAATFSKPFKAMGFLQDSVPVLTIPKRFRSSLEAWGKDIKAWMTFSTAAGEPIYIRTAVSGVSTAGALKNLRELDGETFESLHRKELRNGTRS